MILPCYSLHDDQRHGTSEILQFGGNKEAPRAARGGHPPHAARGTLDGWLCPRYSLSALVSGWSAAMPLRTLVWNLARRSSSSTSTVRA